MNTVAVPARRVVLLGASNLTRGISTVVETARRTWGQPLEVLAALGHGRSYGIESRVLGRTLPGILDCALWDTLSRNSELPTAALITDIGNDILYGVPVPNIVHWIETVLDRLGPNTRICITGLPMAAISELGTARFRIFRGLFFPMCRLSLDEARQRAGQLHTELQSLANAKQLAWIEPRSQWYGLDPIHIRLRHWSGAWGEVLSAWNTHDCSALPARGSLPRWIYLRSRRPHCRAWFGIQQSYEQPSAMLRDGTTVSFY